MAKFWNALGWLGAWLLSVKLAFWLDAVWGGWLTGLLLASAWALGSAVALLTLAVVHRSGNWGIGGYIARRGWVKA